MVVLPHLEPRFFNGVYLLPALWKECCTAEIVEIVDNLCPKRDQGLRVGEYLAIAVINRAVQVVNDVCESGFQNLPLRRNDSGII
jgi:hypothetical protein